MHPPAPVSLMSTFHIRINKVFCFFIALMFTSSESELCSEDTNIYIAQPIRESVCVKCLCKVHQKAFRSKFLDAPFLRSFCL